MARVLIKGGHVVTMNSRREVIAGGSVVIDGDKIVAVGKVVREKADTVINARGKIVLPGLINCHTHLPMTLLRGVADDLPLMEWLTTKVWPLEAKLRAEDCYVGGLLGCLEMIKSGTTCFVDQYFHMDQVASAAVVSGIRGTLAYGIIDLGGSKKRQVEIRIGEKLVKDWHGKANGRVLTMFGPHAPYTCSPECLAQVKELAKKHRVGITIHLSETKDEVKQSVEKCGKRPVEELDSIGFFGPEVLAAHCVWLNYKEVKILRQSGVKPVHNPTSNMKLAAGAAPVTEMLKVGIPVALGTDGAASNNSLDMFSEMKFASLLAKVHSLGAVAVPATAALEMATINGATALGLQNKIGSIETGKKADIILVDLRKPHLTPVTNVISHIVYSATGGDVDTVIVDGKPLMQDRRVLVLEEEKVLEQAQKTSNDLLARLDVKK